jgi:hypothetical protein
MSKKNNNELRDTVLAQEMEQRYPEDEPILPNAADDKQTRPRTTLLMESGIFIVQRHGVTSVNCLVFLIWALIRLMTDQQNST